QITNNGIFDTGVPGAVASIHGNNLLSGTGYYGNILLNGGNFMVGGWVAAPPWNATNVYFMDVLTLVSGGVLVTGQDFGPYVLPPPFVGTGKDQLAVNTLEAPGSPGDPRVVRYINDNASPIVNNGTLEGNEIDLTGGSTWNFQNPYPYDLLITGTAASTTTAGPEMQAGPVGWVNDFDVDFVPSTATENYKLSHTMAPPDTQWYKFTGVFDVKDTSRVEVNDTSGTTAILASVGVGHTHPISGTVLGDGNYGCYGTINDGDSQTDPGTNHGRLEIWKTISQTSNPVTWKNFDFIYYLEINSPSGEVTVESNSVIDDVETNAGTTLLKYNLWIGHLEVNVGSIVNILMNPVEFGTVAKVGTINADPKPSANFIERLQMYGGRVNLLSHIYCERFANDGGIFNFNLYDVYMWENNNAYTRFESNGSSATEFISETVASKSGTIAVAGTENNDVPEVVWNDNDPNTDGNWWGTNGLLVPNAVIGPGVDVTLNSAAGVGGDTWLKIIDPTSTLWINGHQLEIQGSSPAEWHTHDVYRNLHWDAGGAAQGSDGRVKVSGSGVILYSYDADFVLSTLKTYGIDLIVDVDGPLAAKSGTIMNGDPQFEILDDPAEAAANSGSSVKNPDINNGPDFPTDLQVWDLWLLRGNIAQNDNDITVGRNFMMSDSAGEFFQNADGPFDYTGLDRDFGELIMSSVTHGIKNEHGNGTIPHFRTVSSADVEIFPVPISSKLGQTNATYVPIRFGKRVVLGKDAGVINTYGNLKMGDGVYIERRHNNSGINGAVTWDGTANVGIIHTDDANNGGGTTTNGPYPNFNANATVNMGSTGEIPNATTDVGVLQDLTIYLENAAGAQPDYNLNVPIQVNNQLLVLAGELNGTAANTVTMASTVILDMHSDETNPTTPKITDPLLGGPIELIYRGQAGNLNTNTSEWAVDVNVLRVEMGSDGNGDGDGTPVNPLEHHTLTVLGGDKTVQHEVFVQNKTANSYFNLNGTHFYVNGPAPGKKSEGETINAALPAIVTVSAPGGIVNGRFECDGGGGDFFDASGIYASSNGAIVGDGFILNCSLGDVNNRVGEVDLSGRFGFSNQDEFGVAASPPWNADPDPCYGGCLGAAVIGPAVFGSFEGDFNGLSTFTSTGDVSCGDVLAGGPVDIGGDFNGGDIGPQGGCPLSGFTVNINGSGPHGADEIVACDGGGWNGCL
ncbi:hypothetical protein ACFLS9_10240, partial [Bacteroidota bacterium]